MAIKKSELYSSLWKSCDELRGGMDASQYKDYVLVLLFVKYVSDKYAGRPNALIEVPKGGSFADMVALKGDKEIGDKINKIIAMLAEANDLKGVIDVADFNDADKLGKGKEMQDRLPNLVAIFENPALNFRKNRAEGDDILGDAYEYLMRHIATESGKGKGQFYTPAEVSRVMAKVIGINKARSQSQTIYDPTCGSGSLLLKAADESRTGVTIYGQEMDNATAALAKMNMILHDNPTAEIWQDNSLSSPYFKQIELPKYSRMVSVAEIAANDYNLNIPRYIDSTEAEDLHDIAAHLLGGIPNYDIDALDVYWQVFPTLKQQLFEAGPRVRYSQLRVYVEHIKSTIFTHPEFRTYTQAEAELYLQWQTSNMPTLKSLSVGSHPKQLIEALSEDLLQLFAGARLIDKYDVYQYLMGYWTDTMQDDMYMIALDGWKANRDLIPPQLIINRYFVADQQNIETLE